MNNDHEIIQKLLSLLREHGWEGGYKKLAAERREAGDDAKGEVDDIFLGWMHGERGSYDKAQYFDKAAQLPALAVWAVVGRAFVALRQKDFRLAHQLLDEAASSADAKNLQLGAAISHLRGSAYYHQGKAEEAQPLLPAWPSVVPPSQGSSWWAA